MLRGLRHFNPNMELLNVEYLSENLGELWVYYLILALAYFNFDKYSIQIFAN